ncbi:hypothetical protein A3SI_19942 [Nitritalea halalkaliphila LW7]|uniref:Uncharacterized protein n=1 Tax=Nitritalea halalkaliphila LW7 TaxID=1189621 RepID=I5BRI4_9BACT|nr:hypothetical protein [Nitritalea halalkaliphila]EIM72186.1 hypothetical protein A3SI_19942 [Nitritalea halalkaliphila LW7]
MLAINQDGNLTIIELKKEKTSREVVAQGIDYASWVQELTYPQIKSICEEYHKGETFEVLFEKKFFTSPPEETINEKHDILIVCSKLDAQTERIINYLSENYNTPINVAFFQIFKDDEKDYLTRSWLIDPKIISAQLNKTDAQKKGEVWNGRDFVANIGYCSDGTTSSWTDCKKYGIISAGGGRWYSNSLKQLFVGARVFAMIPKQGYVNVGIVEETAVPAKQFTIKQGNETRTLQDLDFTCDRFTRQMDDLENGEYIVKVRWLIDNPNDATYWESGLRANQNSVFKLKNKFTIDKLTAHFRPEE